MEKILITPHVGMGDTLLTTPALELLKKYHPEYKVTFLTLNRMSFQILLNNPNVDSLLYYPLTSAGFMKGVAYIVKNICGRYTTSVNFYPSNRAAYNLFALLSGARKRIGHRYLKSDFAQLNWLKNRTFHEDRHTHCVVKNVQLLSFIDKEFNQYKSSSTIPQLKIYLTDEEEEAGAQLRKTFTTSPVVGVHTGSSTFKGHIKKRWPADHFKGLIDSTPDVSYFLFGAREEAKENEYIVSHVKNPNQVKIVSDTTIREAAACIGKLDAFVSNDSGLMHIAAAMGVPIVAMLGPTNHEYIHPWKVSHTVLRTGIKCSPCFYHSPSPLSCELDGSFRCLSEITVEEVRKELISTLS